MGPLRELIAVDERRALEYFVAGLQEVCGTDVDRHELLYNASVLAHYAQVSTHADLDMPAPTALGEVFDHFVIESSVPCDGLIMETAGAQCLLLTGFFENQMRGRYNLRWYAELGAGFFIRAAAQQRSTHKARLLQMVGRHFEPWRQRHARLGRELRDQVYLLPPTPPAPLM
ncbi:MAG TPA: hypothetical protein VFO58_07455 [Vicinamibacterales bacterium]|nr:hypothetical protein [Vicinamibacterales bacterium]